MNWSDVLADPSLQDLPYKIETNEHGQIVMSPASPRHSRQQGRLVAVLESLMANGEAFVECPIETSLGVKVPDAVWASDAYLKRHGDVEAYPEAPEICIEVLSKSNTVKEIDEKRSLYFERGAQEVWVCDVEGRLSFFNAQGSIDASRLAPGFPARVELR